LRFFLTGLSEPLCEVAEPGHLKGLTRRSTDVDEPQLSRDAFCGAIFSLSSSCGTDFGRNLQKS
jgi:hypothetical protein